MKKQIVFVSFVVFVLAVFVGTPGIVKAAPSGCEIQVFVTNVDDGFIVISQANEFVEMPDGDWAFSSKILGIVPAKDSSSGQWNYLSVPCDGSSMPFMVWKRTDPSAEKNEFLGYLSIWSGYIKPFPIQENQVIVLGQEFSSGSFWQWTPVRPGWRGGMNPPQPRWSGEKN